MRMERSLFYASSLMHTLAVAFLGYLIPLGSMVDVPLLLSLFLFVASSKLFSIMFGEDMGALRKTRVYSAIPLFASVAAFIDLSLPQVAIGTSVLLLYAFYPVVRGRAWLDVGHHALRYVLLFLLAYGSSSQCSPHGSDSLTILLALLCIVLFAVAGELVSGLRKGARVGGTTSFLGVEMSSVVAALSVLFASLVSAYVLNGIAEFPVDLGGLSIPFYVIPSMAVACLITKPLIGVQARGESRRPDTFYSTRKREMAAALTILIVAFAFLRLGEVNVDEPVDSENYSFEVEVRTIMAGKYSWDVPWILFDYVDQSNHFYFLLHKDGVLELSRVTGGRSETYVATLKTDLSPFQPHSYHASMTNTTVVVTVDGVHRLVAPRQAHNGTCRVRVSSRTPCLWLAYVGELELSTE